MSEQATLLPRQLPMPSALPTAAHLLDYIEGDHVRRAAQAPSLQLAHNLRNQIEPTRQRRPRERSCQSHLDRILAVMFPIQ
jgi:hypothetical protein